MQNNLFFIILISIFLLVSCSKKEKKTATKVIETVATTTVYVAAEIISNSNNNTETIKKTPDLKSERALLKIENCKTDIKRNFEIIIGPQINCFILDTKTFSFKFSEEEYLTVLKQIELKLDKPKESFYTSKNGFILLDPEKRVIIFNLK